MNEFMLNQSIFVTTPVFAMTACECLQISDTYKYHKKGNQLHCFMCQ